MITDKQLADLADSIHGTCDDLETACERLNIPVGDVNDLEAELLEHNTERCEGCGWWCESSELARLGDTDLGVGLCQGCKDDQFG